MGNKQLFYGNLITNQPSAWKNIATGTGYTQDMGKVFTPSWVDLIQNG
jgi:hypothetical protein